MVRLAKLVLLLFTLLGAGWFLLAVPFGGWRTMQEFPGLQAYIVPWLLLTEPMAVPACIAVINAWKIVRTLGRQSVHTQRNLRRFRRTAVTAIITVLYFCGGCAALYALGYFHPAVYPVGIPVAFSGVAVVGVACLIAYTALHTDA